MQIFNNSISNITSLQLFQLIRFGTTAFISIVLVKLGASTNAIATYETFLWLTGMFSFFWIAGTINAMLSIKKDYQEGEVFSNTALMILWQSVIAVQLLVVFQFFNNGNGILTSMAAGYLLFNTVSFLNEYIYFIKAKQKQLITYAIATSLLQIAFTIIPFLLTNEILWAISGLALLAIAKLFWLIHLLKKTAVFTFNKSYVAALIKVSLPITAGIFASGCAEYIDGFLVKHFFDENAFAIYRYGARELPFALILANSLSTAMIAPIALNINSGIAALKRKTAQLAMMIFPFSIVLMLNSKWLFVNFYNQSFLPSAAIFNVLLLLVIPRLLFPQAILTALRMNNFTLISALLEITINLVTSVLLMQHFGLIGIAYGTLLAFIFDKVFLVCALYYKQQIAPTAYIPITQYLLGSIGLIAAFFLTFYLQ
jgi:O-antigen/teichoic acid export membrane protein